MAKDRFVLTESQSQRIAKMLAHYERTGRRFTGPGQRPRALGSPVPFQIGKAFEDIDADDSGTIRPWILPSTADSTDPFIAGSTVDMPTAHDWFGTGATEDDEVMMYRHQQSGRLVFLRSDRRATCLLKGALTASSTSATVDNVSPIVGVSATTAAGVELEVANTHNWSGADDGLARIEWHGTNRRWELYQVTCACPTS